MSLSESAIGYLAAGGAAFFYGSMAIPIKLPAVIKANVDPMVFQCYYSFAVFCSSWIVVLFQPLNFSWYGILGAGLWVPASVLAITAINMIGMALTAGIWSGTTILVSFLWGTIIFKESINNWFLTIIGLILLLSGIGGIALCNQQWKITLPPNWKFLYKFVSCIREDDPVQENLTQPDTPLETISCELNPTDRESHELENKQQTTEPEPECETIQLEWPNESDSLEQKYPEAKVLNQSMEQPEKSVMNVQPQKHVYLMGILCAMGLGILYGSMMVPAKLVSEDEQGFPYVVSFAIGAAIVTLIDAPLYFGIQIFRGKGTPDFCFKVAAIPGIVSGLVWNAGNICSIFAVKYLGMAIGFPLTQTDLLVFGFWGMLLYREITRPLAIISFFAYALLLLAGDVFLSLFA